MFSYPLPQFYSKAQREQPTTSVSLFLRTSSRDPPFALHLGHGFVPGLFGCDFDSALLDQYARPARLPPGPASLYWAADTPGRA